MGDDPGRGLEDPGAEAAEEALDQRHTPSVGISRDERDRVTRDARRHGAGGRMSVEAATHDVAQGSDVPIVQEPRDVDRHRLGVGEVTVAIGGGRHQDPGEGRGIHADRVGVDAEALDRGQCFQEHEALGGRRRHRDIEVPVASPERREEVRGVRGEVLGGDGRAERAKPGHEAFGDIARGEGVGALVRDGRERARQGRLPEGGALRRDAVGVEDVRESGIRAKLLGAPRDAPREIAGDGCSLGGIDRGAERVGPRPDGALAVQGLPSPDGAGHRDRGRAGLGHGGAVRAAEVFGVGAGRCAAGGIDRHELPVGVLHEGEEVAAHSAHVRGDDRERHGGVQRGVDGVPPARERRCRRLRGPRVRGGDGPSLAARGERPSVGCRRLHPRRVSPR